jgi:hypothetical protein
MLIWAAIVHEFCCRQLPLMGVLILIGVSSYARPGELLAMRRGDIIGPVSNASPNWCLLLRPEEMAIPTKTGDFDDSVPMDTAFMSEFMPELLQILSEGPKEELVFNFSYPSFWGEFKKVLIHLGLGKSGIVPYSWRHSGPSIDRAQGHRSAAEVAKRGRWRQPKSAARYEKAGRLGATLKGLPSSLLDHARICERHLAAIALGGRHEVERYVKGSSS